MPKQKLFDDDSEEDEISLRTENEYAKKYDRWREKEELHKLEQKYGSNSLNPDGSGSSDSEDDEEPPEISPETEKQFLKTLSLLKTKDPRIYDPKFNFFDNSKTEKEIETKKKTISFADSDEDDDEDGEIFKVEKIAPPPTTEKERHSTQKKIGKEDKLKAFLTGEVEHIDDEVERDLAPLKALWSDPAINEGEAFLRDYILNKRYLEEGGAGEAEDKLRDDEDLEEDEARVEEQGKFERAYNFRFEEPDDEYLKRYPRTMNFIRPKDDKRARKRAEVRSRKDEEKQRKMEEIGRMKALKLKEIQEKIAKIKEVTGNEELAFRDEDIEGDFDPEEHDRRMQALFNEEFYGDVDDQKPVFPDLDEELEIENWEKYDKEVEVEVEEDRTEENEGPHCEDEDFNMDADYDPKKAKANLLEELKSTMGKKRRNRKKKSKLAKLLAGEKPTYVPTLAEKTYSEYMEEYYKMDCEDVIGGDLPTRFKYREVVPNNFGLSIEEILLADDKELTQWVPLKKILKLRPENVEKGEVKTYQMKATDERLKKKILPSLYKDLPEQPEIVVPLEESTKGKKKKKKKNIEVEIVEKNPDMLEETADNISHLEERVTISGNTTESKIEKKKKKKNKANVEETKFTNNHVDDENITNDEDTKRKKKKKHKDGFEVETIDNAGPSHDNASISDIEDENRQNSPHKVNSKKLKRKLEENNDVKTDIAEVPRKKNKQKQKKINADTQISNIVQNNKIDTESQQRNDGKTDVILTQSKKKNKKQQTPVINAPGLNMSKNKKNKKFKSKEKGRFKKSTNQEAKPSNPLTNLSDERLKAYGLNPKKYRSFLKYKKF